jgi:CRISPR-associated protein Csd2
MASFNRGTGLLIIEARASNPNGDPDRESDPRTLSTDERGIISPVSFKRKIRDLASDKEGEAWSAAASAIGVDVKDPRFEILETRGRDRDAIKKMNREKFVDTFWDGRVFGNTFLEKDDKSAKAGEADHFISTGVVQFGVGVSIAPIEIERMTNTNKSGVQEGKDRGMAPLGYRVVRHGVYAMPFFVNSMMARKTGCSEKDVALLKFLIPHAYRQTASAIRPFVEVRHAWYAEHLSPLGSCPDSLVIDAMSPRKESAPDSPSKSIAEYAIPSSLPDTTRKRIKSLVDLCVVDNEK